MSGPFDQLFQHMGKVELPSREAHNAGLAAAVSKELEKLEIGEVLKIRRPDNWPEGKRFLPLSNAARRLDPKKKFSQSSQKDGTLWIKRLS